MKRLKMGRDQIYSGVTEMAADGGCLLMHWSGPLQVEKYAPGLPQKIKVNSVKAWVYLSNTSYDLFAASKTFVAEKVLM